MRHARHLPNGLLASLSGDDFELVRPHLRSVELTAGEVLAEVNETQSRVFLLHRGLVSLFIRLADGGQVQIAMVGSDSLFGSFPAIGDAVALYSAVVLMPGVASTLDINRLRAAADQSSSLRAALVRHELAILAQIQQTAACNVAHSAEARIARMLLEMRDFSGSETLMLKQETIAEMIGTRRNSVSQAASALQQARCISYRRGAIEITSPEGLSEKSCECYGRVKARYRRLLNLK